MSQTQTGAKLTLLIRGIPVAYASNAQYVYTQEIDSIRAIDNIAPAENAEVGISVTFSASMFRVAYQTAITNGWMPKISAFLQQPELTAVITSSVVSGSSGSGQTTLVTISGLKCTGRSGSVDARGVWTETLTFVGKTFTDESG